MPCFGHKNSAPEEKTDMKIHYSEPQAAREMKHLLATTLWNITSAQSGKRRLCLAENSWSLNEYFASSVH